MKKNLLILALSLSCCLVACKKSAETAPVVIETNTELAVTAENTLNVQSVKNLPSQDLKRIAYGLLKPIEKYILWLDNIRTVSADFNPEQKVLAYELIGSLSPSAFAQASSTPAMTSFRDKWLAKAEKVFTKKQIRALSYQIFSSTDVKAQLAVNLESEDGKTPNCNCNGGATLTCDGVSFCPTDKVNGDCKNPTSWGCGFMYLYACNNKCVAPPLSNEE